jgi:hypothetical protein
MRLLRVTADHFVAGAEWQGKRCVRAAPILQWMVGKDPQRVRAWLISRGYTWEWLNA